MSDRTDKIISGSTVKFGENSKGNRRVQFYLSKETAHELAALIVQKSEEGTGMGVQLDIHETVTQKEGRTIRGGFLFCKEKKAQQERQAKKEYKPKSTQDDIINKLKSKQVG